MKLPTLEQFDIMCRDHDWFYMHSDDHRAWSKGKTNANLLDSIVNTGGQEYKEVYLNHVKQLRGE